MRDVEAVPAAHFVPSGVGRTVLDLTLAEDNDAGALTVREYLTTLLRTLWIEGECFSGKRPLGNSGWQHDLYVPLVKAGLVKGSFDEFGSLDDFDEHYADRLILAAIRALGEVHG